MSALRVGSVPVVVTADIGGTRTKVGVVHAETLEVRSTAVFATGATFGEAVTEAGRCGAELVRETERIVATGLALPGTLVGGVVTSLPGKLPGAEGADAARRFAETVDEAARGGHGGYPAAPTRPRTAVNDARAYALGEAVAGAARGAGRAVVVTLGTGVGVCVVEHTRVALDAPHGGGSLGGWLPMPAEFHGAGGSDSRGRTGTIEALCASAQLAACARAEGSRLPDAASVLRAVDIDAGCGRALAEYRRRLAAAICVLAGAYAPDVIVVGGGIARPNSALLDGLDGLAGALMRAEYDVVPVPVRAAELADAAALVGVAALVTGAAHTGADGPAA